MSKKREIKIILQDILDETNRINKFTHEIVNFQTFAKNELVFYAVLKALENVGEAVKNIPEDIKQQYPLEWKKIAGLRDVIIHEYFGIDAEIIWDVVKNKIPELERAVNSLISKGKAKP